MNEPLQPTADTLLCWFRDCQEKHPEARYKVEVTCPTCRLRLRDRAPVDMATGPLLKLMVERAFADTVLTEPEYRWCLAKMDRDEARAAECAKNCDPNRINEVAPLIYSGLTERNQ
jgi:hypothetical protein